MKENKLNKVYVSKVRDILIITKEFKNGLIYGDEISPTGVEDFLVSYRNFLIRKEVNKEC